MTKLLLTFVGVLALVAALGGCTPQETQMFADSMVIDDGPAPVTYEEPPEVPGLVVDNPIYNRPEFRNGYYDRDYYNRAPPSGGYYYDEDE